MQVFKRHNPSTAEEQEMMENLFDSLCSCLMLSSNRDRFLKGEGLQLMNLMLRYPHNFVIFLPAFDVPAHTLARYLWFSVYKIFVLAHLFVSWLFIFFPSMSVEPSQTDKLNSLSLALFPENWGYYTSCWKVTAQVYVADTQMRGCCRSGR